MKKRILLALLLALPVLAETKVRDSIRLGGPINVKDKGCVGDDVADDTACLATVQGLLVANQTVIFPAGTYKYTASPNWNARNVHLIGAGSSLTTLHFIGTGNAVVFDGGAVVGEVTGATMQGFLVKGNVNATNGIFLRAVHHSTFRDVRVHDVAASCLLINFAVVDTFDTFRCSVNEGSAWVVRPCQWDRHRQARRGRVGVCEHVHQPHHRERERLGHQARLRRAEPLPRRHKRGKRHRHRTGRSVRAQRVQRHRP
jgi:hypothetical protein